jgi:hypothetical protein
MTLTVDQAHIDQVLEVSETVLKQMIQEKLL